MGVIMYKINFDDLDNILDIENNKINRIKNNIYLSNNQIDILKRYNINYLKYKDISSLIFDIETLLNDGYGDIDLENLSSSLQELNYYNNTNK